jgi:cobalt-zinc-cadmium efflux system outer membrane protein
MHKRLQRIAWMVVAAAGLLPAVGRPQALPERVLSRAQAEQLWLAQGRELRLARLAVAAAAADADQAAVRPNPTLSWNAQAIPTSGAPLNRHVDQVLRLDQPIERGDKRGLRQRAAQALLEAAHADLRDQRRRGLAALQAAYDELMLAEQRLQVFRLTDASHQRSLAAARQRVQAGDLAQADLARLTVEALRAAADTVQAEADRQQARSVLASLLAIEADAPRLVTEGDWPQSAQAADAGPRPDLVSAQRQADAAEARWQLARAQRVRDVTVGVQLERYPGPGNSGNTVGIGLSVPLFWGDDQRAQERRAVADRDTAQAQLDKARAQAETEQAQARSALAAAQQRDASFRGGLIAAAEQAAQAAEVAYTRGALSVMELMDARRTLLSARLDALQAHADLSRALTALRAASNE